MMLLRPHHNVVVLVAVTRGARRNMLMIAVVAWGNTAQELVWVMTKVLNYRGV